MSIKNKSARFREIIKLIIMKMKIQIKNRSYRYHINRPRHRHGHKYTIKIKSVSVWWCLYKLGKYLSNIRSSIHENVKQHRGWVKKSVAYKKECVAQVEIVRSKNNKKHVQIKINCLMC